MADDYITSESSRFSIDESNETEPVDDPLIRGVINQCFGCSTHNPASLRLKFSIDASDLASITAKAGVVLESVYQGAPGFLHGGIIATLLDEAMGKLNKPLGAVAMTRHLEVNFLRPSPVQAPLTLISWHRRRDGRKLFHSAQLLDVRGDILASAEGLFVVVERPQNSK